MKKSPNVRCCIVFLSWFLVAHTQLHAMCYRLWTQILKNFLIRVKLWLCYNNYYYYVACTSAFVLRTVFYLCLFYAPISATKLSLLMQFMFFTTKRILRGKKQWGVAIWKFWKFVSETVRTWFFFFTPFSNHALK